jgi:hypothetical protein
VRWTWALGADTDATIGLAAAALARCLDDLALDARGGRAEVIVERDRLGIRGEFDPAAWREVGAVAGCVAAPDRSAAGHARDRARLEALAAAVAASPIRRGLAAFATATYGDHALAHALAVELPLIGPDDVIAWWAARRAGAAAVVAAVGPLDLADLAPLIAGEPVRPAGAPGGRPMAPPPRELFVDGRRGERAIVLGFDALTAGDRDRAALDVLARLLAAPDGALRRALPGARVRVAVADAVDAGYLAIALEQPRDADAAVRRARRWPRWWRTADRRAGGGRAGRRGAAGGTRPRSRPTRWPQSSCSARGRRSTPRRWRGWSRRCCPRRARWW